MDDDRLFEGLRMVDSVGEPEARFLERLYVAAADELGFERPTALRVARVTGSGVGMRRPADARRRLNMAALAGVAAVLVVSLVGIAILGGNLGVGVTPSPPASPSPSASGSPTPGPTADEWWRTGVSGAAAGALAAGTHRSTSLQPTLTYAVPEGWVNNYDRVDGFQLMPDTPGNRLLVEASRRSPGSRAASPTYRYVTVLRNERLAAADCSDNPEPGAGFGAKDLVSALAKRSGLTATTPVPVAVGGLSGWQVDLAVASTWTTPCPDSNGAPAVPTIQSGDANWWLVGGDRTRYIVLDDPEAGNILIEVTAAPADTFDAHLAASLPIIESFVFDVAPHGSTSPASPGPSQ